jgi:hypothetical protein
MPKDEDSNLSRRKLLGGTAALMSGSVLGGLLTACSERPADEPTQKPETAGEEPPPLPWSWPGLDPMEAGRRAYQNYFKGGCGHGAYSALLSLLKEKAGYPWTTLPERMMVHAAAGYGGHGTLCGSLGGASLIVNLVAYEEGEPLHQQLIDRLYHWYAEQNFPPKRFDDISKMPDQVQVQAMTPLCHTSVTKWMNVANATVTSLEKKERCAKVTGEVVYVTTMALNEYAAGKWTPVAWKPSKETRHCVTCHGPDDMFHTKASKNSQQGHMECVLCHDDHTK